MNPKSVATPQEGKTASEFGDYQCPCCAVIELKGKICQKCHEWETRPEQPEGAGQPAATAAKGKVESDEFYLEKAVAFLGQSAKMNDAPLPYMVAAAFKNGDKILALEAENASLRTGNTRLAVESVTLAVELRSLRAQVEQLRNYMKTAEVVGAGEPWDDDERKACRREWEDRVVAAIDQNVEDHLGPDKADAEYEAGLHLVRQLRSLTKMLSRAEEIILHVSEDVRNANWLKVECKEWLNRVQTLDDLH